MQRGEQLYVSGTKLSPRWQAVLSNSEPKQTIPEGIFFFKGIFFVTITKKLSNKESFLQMSYLLIGYIVSVCEADGVILLISPRNKSQ